MQISSQNYVLAFVHHKYEYAYTRLRTKINLWMHVGVYMTLRTRLNNEARIHRFIALRWVNSKKKKTRVNHFPTTVPLRSSAYFKWNWSFQQFRLCSASFLTSRDRSASPFSSLFFSFQKSSYTSTHPEHFACTKPCKAAERLNIFAFCSTRFYGQISVGPWRVETFQTDLLIHM